MRRIDLKSLAMGMVAGAAVVFTIAASTSSTERMPVEYRVVVGDLSGGSFHNALNRAAEEGWRLESTGPAADRHAFAVMSRLKR